ncbi:MAG: aminotransferase class I/II-fold pyridoxal phosphate-dependent enzyme [Acidimicrobiia bacterium]|nr:aminotransferase class I/II-fold pyridoxal phosphate-dependent enzyme [Acidimicrobiia bacterium]
MDYAPIHLSPPDMSVRERRRLLDAFDSNWIAPAGPELNEFESRLRSIAGTEAAVATTSGTAALHLALQVLDVGPGDVVLVPTVTFVASANVVRYVGAEPHFVDCDPRTGNIDPGELECALDTLARDGIRPAAVITVDLYGACANYRLIERICARFDVPIVEDAAESIGATHSGKPAGSFGKLAAFSFNGNKLVTTGGGGALVGPSELVERARYLASQAREAAVHFEHGEIGYAYRLSNLSAALGSAQLERLDLLVARTRVVHRRYMSELGRLEGVEVMSQDRDGRGNGWLSVVELDQQLLPSPAAVCGALAAVSIEARPAWKPMHLQPLYSDSPMTGGASAELHYSRGICLPSGSSLTVEQQTRVIAAFTEAVSSEKTTDLTTKIDLRGSMTEHDHADVQAA